MGFFPKAVAFLFVCILSVHARVCIWNGGIGNWNVSANWGGFVPTSTDTAIISVGSPAPAIGVQIDALIINGTGYATFPAGLVVREVWLGGQGSMRIGANNPLVKVSMKSLTIIGTNFSIDTAEVMVTDNVAISGFSTLIAGSMQSYLTFNQSCVSSIRNSVSISGTLTVRNFGAINFNSSVVFKFDAFSTTFQNGASGKINISAAIYFNTTNVNGNDFMNDGNITIANNASLNLQSIFYNKGAIYIGEGAALRCSGKGISEGNFFISELGSAEFSTSQDYSFGETSRIEGGMVTFSNGINANVEGIFNSSFRQLGGRVTIEKDFDGSSRTVYVDNGSLTVSNAIFSTLEFVGKNPQFTFRDVNITSLFRVEYSSDDVRLEGRNLVFLKYCEVILNAENAINFQVDRDFINRGTMTVNLKGPRGTLDLGSDFTNEGNLNLIGANGDFVIKSATFLNKGNMLIKLDTQNATAITLNSNFDNGGSVTVGNGTFTTACNDECSHSGNFTGTAPTSGLIFNGGLVLIEPTCSIENLPITFRFASTTVMSNLAAPQVTQAGGFTTFIQDVDVDYFYVTSGQIAFSTKVDAEGLIMTGGSANFDQDVDLGELLITGRGITQVTFAKTACLEDILLESGSVRFGARLTVKESLNLTATNALSIRSTVNGGSLHLMKGSYNVFNGNASLRFFDSIRIYNWGLVEYSEITGLQLINGSAWVNERGSILSFVGNQPVTFGASANHYLINYGAITAKNAVIMFPRIQNYGTMTFNSSLSCNSTVTQYTGKTSLAQGLSASTFELRAGVLEGKGTFNARIVQNGGVLRPGSKGSIGKMIFTSTYEATANASIELEAGSSASFDQIEVQGAATFPGNIRFNTINSYVPFKDTVFEGIITAGSFGGAPTYTSDQWTIEAGVVGAAVQITVTEISPEFTCTPACANGYCVDSNTCRCGHGWQGADCSIPICPFGCNGGTCNGSNICMCDGIFAGFSCDVAYACGCSPFANETCASAPVLTTGVDYTTGAMSTGAITSGVITTGKNLGGATSDETTAASTTEVTDSPSSDSGDSRRMAAIIGGAVGGAVLLLIAVILIGVLIARSKRRRGGKAEPVALASIEMEPKINWEQGLKNIRVIERLGGGNFGDVYRGEWNGATPVAMKKVKHLHMLNDFLREANILGSLNHPNIVRYFGFFMDEKEDRYIVMEYVPQGSLEIWLKKQRDELSDQDLMAIATQAAAGMAYLESRNIIHRDLALRNLLLSKENNKFVVKVADFGMSRTTEEGVYTMSSQGDIPFKWTAPEAINSGTFSTKTDVWSFGVTLWELFSFGDAPYPSFGNKQAVEQVMKGYRMPKPERCPRETYQIIKACWAENPEDRPTFAQIHAYFKASDESILPNPGGESEYQMSPNTYQKNDYNNSKDLYNNKSEAVYNMSTMD
eukprot:TRINITY_DN785_c0_g1_i1.p1 TRINITY_DN785_c0_g1~~TRINITY_DN785_c0_g1_i1.p1  ORF type:complete len:1422 (-),score=266.01 TRINITY_DN785_c0_g1_i1:73-4338(-)